MRVRHRVSDLSRPRRIAKAIRLRLSEAGITRDEAGSLDIVARMYGYRDHAELEADIGQGRAARDDREAGTGEAARRHAHQVSVLVEGGVDPAGAEAIVTDVSPTATYPRPLAVDPTAERLRTPAGVRRALAEAGAHIAKTSADLSHSKGVSGFGAWSGMAGTIDRKGLTVSFALAVSDDGLWVMASREAGKTPADLVADRLAGRRDGFRGDLSAVLELAGYLDVGRDAPTGKAPDAGKAARLLLRLDSDVLCEMRTLHRFSCETYEMLRGLPDVPGSVRRLIREVPLLAGFAVDHCEMMAFAFKGMHVATPLLALSEGPEGLAKGQGRFKAPQPARVAHVVGALAGVDVRLGNRMSLTAIRHLGTLPSEAIPVGHAQIAAMFDTVDSLVRFEEAGMRVSRLYEGLQDGDWVSYAERVGAYARDAEGLPALFRMMGASALCGDVPDRIADDLVAGFAHAMGLDPATVMGGGFPRAVSTRLSPWVLRNRALLDYLDIGRKYDDLMEANIWRWDAAASAGDARNRLGAAADVLPEELRGRECVDLIEALGYDPAEIAAALAKDPNLAFDTSGMMRMPSRLLREAPPASVTAKVAASAGAEALP